MTGRKNNWMQKTFKNAGSGLFHKQLGISPSVKIPLTFLQTIVDTKIGNDAHNPTEIGNRSVKVTTLVKRRANALLNADRANK
jgi:hypothetical protein